MSRHHLDRLALLSPSVEAPLVRKAAALLGFDRLDGAGVDALEKNAGAVGVGFEREARATGAEFGMAGDEVRGGHAEKVGDGVDFVFVYAHESRPAAAVAAALAEVARFAQAKTSRHTMTEAITPARSASNPAGTAWRVRRTATDPK